MILTEFSPRTPESDSITMLRIFCEKFHSTERIVRFSSRLISSVNSSLVRGRELPAGIGHWRVGFQAARSIPRCRNLPDQCRRRAARLASGPSPPRGSASRFHAPFATMHRLPPARYSAGTAPAIQIFPSSSSGMNSRPSNGIAASGACHQQGEKGQGQPAMVQAALQLPQVRSFASARTRKLSRVGLRSLRKNEQSTGERANANNNAPPRAKA